MNCELLNWAYAQEQLPPAHFKALAMLVRRSIDGRATIAKAELGALIDRKERQTHTILSDLARAGLIAIERNGGTGQGRVANSYRLTPEATGNELPKATSNPLPPAIALPAMDCTIHAEATGSPLPGSDGNPQSIAGIALPVEATGNSPPTPPYKNNTLRVGSSSETPEPSGEGVLGGEPFELRSPTPQRRAKPKRSATEATMPREPSARMIADATASGLVNGAIRRRFDEWRDWHLSKATEIADHEASFRTWLRNSQKFAERNGPARPVQRNGVRRNIYLEVCNAKPR